MDQKPTYEDLLKKIAALEAALAHSKKIEQRLRDSEFRLAEMIDILPDAMFAIDIEGRVIAWNQAIEALSGVKAEEIVGKGNYEYAIPFYGIRRPVMIDQVMNWDPHIEKKYAHIKRRGDILESETRNPPFRKSPAYLWNSARPLYNASGEMVGALEVIRDITAIKQAHEELKAHEQLLQIYVEHTPAPVAMCDRNMCYLALSRRWIEDYGLAGDDLLGRCHYDVFGNIPLRWQAEHQRVFAGESIRVPAELFQRRDGSEIWLKRELVPWRDTRGEIGGLIIFNEMITERKQAEDALSAEKERLAVTLRSIGDAVISTDRQGTITMMNSIAGSLTGWSESAAVGQPLKRVFRIVNEISRQPCESPVEQVIEKGTIVSLANHTLLMGKDGSEYIIADSGAPIRDADGDIVGVVLVFRDITEARRTEAELMKMEKLESLGVLAGGIAHDFNNFLTAIIGNISLAKLDVGPSQKISTQLNAMEKAAMRAQALTQQLLTFSRGGQPVRRPIRLNDLVREAAQFALHGTNVRCVFDFGPDQLAAEADDGQITQVIHNLVLNAQQAMPEGGVIDIVGELIALAADNLLSLPAGDFVRLSIRDQGIGIQRDHLKKVFDPYFSTKHKGSGLGLAVAYSVIEKHQGRITVDAEPGKGSAFTIYLPAIPTADVTTDDSTHRLVVGSGRILVMDDDENIRSVAAEMLEVMGFSGTVARDGAEAIVLYREARHCGRPFAAVILDLTVPGGMGGKETIKRLREIDPDVTAIVSSGYSNDPVLSNCSGYGFRQAVGKPYRLQELSDALHTALRNPGVGCECDTEE